MIDYWLFYALPVATREQVVLEEEEIAAAGSKKKDWVSPLPASASAPKSPEDNTQI
jgi:hypothetical protein